MSARVGQRRICVVTGSRADYGLLYWLMRRIAEDPELDLQVVATGMHLSPEFGNTYRAIEDDGFTLAARVESLLSSDTEIGVAKSMGLGLIGFADCYSRLRPDLNVVLGDRFEIFAAASAALYFRIPTAHIHGGEITEGAFDESIRHAITKLSHLHFASADAHRRRLIQLGESPDRVHTVGAPGVEAIERLSLLPRDEVERILGLRLRATNVLVTIHPATLDDQTSSEALTNEILSALDRFPEVGIVFTKTNADTDGRIINQLVDRYVARNAERAGAYVSLGRVRYASVMNQVDAVLGNSSSAVIEAPALHKPAVDVGMRQRGRLKAASTIECAAHRDAIAHALAAALSPSARDAAATTESPYGSGRVSDRIVRVLKTVDLAGLTTKRFHDL